MERKLEAAEYAVNCNSIEGLKQFQEDMAGKLEAYLVRTKAHLYEFDTVADIRQALA